MRKEERFRIEAIVSSKGLCRMLDKVKINFDAAVDREGQRVGMAVIARDSTGSFIKAAARYVKTQWPVELAEAEACLMAMEMARTFHGITVIVEGDSQLIIHQVNGNVERRGAEKGVIEEIKSSREGLLNVTLRWISRNGNEAADRLAKAACYREIVGAWNDTPPPILADCLM